MMHNGIELFFLDKERDTGEKTLKDRVDNQEREFAKRTEDPSKSLSRTDKLLNRYENGLKNLQNLTEEELGNLKEILNGQKKQIVKNLFDSMDLLQQDKENLYDTVPPNVLGGLEELSDEELKELKETLLEQKQQKMRDIFNTMEAFYCEEKCSYEFLQPTEFWELLNDMADKHRAVNRRKKVMTLDEVFQKRSQ